MGISENAKSIYGNLTGRGVPSHVAAGLVGNIMQESGANINPLAVGDNGNAFGMAQWNGPRRRALVDWARTSGKDPRSIEAQTDFLMHEFATTEKGAMESVFNSPDVDSATLAASNKFWRPGDPRNENRLRYARDVYAELGGEAPAAPEAESPVTDPSILGQLEGGAGGEESPVTDPAILQQLNAEGPTRAAAEAAGLPPSLEQGQVAEGQARTQEPTAFGGMLDSFMNGVLMGYGDEVRAFDAAITGETPEGEYFNYDRPFWERYNVAKGAEETQRKAYQEENPVKATTAEIGGALSAAGGLGKQGVTLAGRGVGLGQKAGLGALEGGAYGALYGSGESDPGQRLKGALWGGGAGAALGGAITIGAQKFATALQQRGLLRSAPTPEMLRRTATEAADTAKAQGVVFSQKTYEPFLRDLTRDLMEEGVDKTITPRASAALKRLTELSGKNPSFKELEKMRRIAASAAKSIEPADRRLAMMMVDKIDEFVATPGNVAHATGDAALASASLVSMRRDWGRMRRAEMLDEALMKAERRSASTGSGGNIENAIRQNIRSILDSPTKRRGFSAPELAAMEDVVRGGSVRSALRLLGKISPQGNGLSAFLNIGAVYLEPSFLAATLFGTGAKALADRMARKSADVASALVRTGGQSPALPRLPGPRATPALGGLAGGLMGQGQ